MPWVADNSHDALFGHVEAAEPYNNNQPHFARAHKLNEAEQLRRVPMIQPADAGYRMITLP